MIKALRPHWIFFVALLVLLATTATCAGIPLGWVNLPLSLVIGATKTAIVALFFMELRKDRVLLRLAAMVGILWLAIFLMLALSDYATRFPGITR